MANLVLKKIARLSLPLDQYYKEVHAKNQIYLHHTASGKGATGDWRHFMSDPYRIATCVIVGDDVISQLFSSRYWGHHLGIKPHVFRDKGLPSINKQLNKESIAIEIDSWGQVAQLGAEYFVWTGKKIPREEVVIYDDPFKEYVGGRTPNFFDDTGIVGDNCHLYHKYTDNQVEYVKQLLQYWNKRYNIPIKYLGDTIFELMDEALTGVPGVYTHNSVRTDKVDIHPQPEIIEMLKSL